MKNRSNNVFKRIKLAFTDCSNRAELLLEFNKKRLKTKTEENDPNESLKSDKGDNEYFLGQ